MAGVLATSWIDRMVATGDALRRGVWRPLARLGIVRRAIVDRDLRLLLLAATHGGVALLLAAVAPLWLLLLGPLLLGVPHVAGDLRYLVLEPRLPWRRGGLLAVLLLLGLMTAHRGALALGWQPSSVIGLSALEFELGLGGACVLAAALFGAASSARRRLLGSAAAFGLCIMLLCWPHRAFVAFAHAHNVVGVAVWLLLAADGPRRGGRWLLAGLWLGGHALLLGGTLDGVSAAAGAYWAPASGLDFAAMGDQLAPGLEWPHAARWVQSFAFGQSVHYLVWTRLLPQQCDPRAAPSTFRADLQMARRVFRRGGLALLAALGVGLPLLALVIGARARDGYLHAIAFHGWLELAALAAWGVGRRSAAGAAVRPTPRPH
ncbi:MAG: hypothetical protein H6747_12975 [Deltaproteobacteria bacterium]|nr:hypothetical protein [Deltaproteobacteria bacterium]